MRIQRAVPCAVFILTLSVVSSLTAQPNQQVSERAEHYRPEALTLLEKLVNIDSGTGDEKGVEQVSALVVNELTKIGAHIESFPSTPVAGNNVVATFTGTGKGKILLIAHMDTVFSKGTASARPFRVDGSRAYGPGVGDDKGGLVAALYSLKILHDLDFRDYGQISLLLNTNEETGSLGSRFLIEKIAKQHDVVLNCEAGRSSDGVVIWRKGWAVAQIEVKGKAAHAGVAPETGRNAAVELAHQILQLGKLGDAEKLTTINFTVLKAGDKPNVIPDHAVALGDVRATTTQEFDRLEKDLSRVSQNKLIADTEVKVTLTRNIPPMPKNEKTDAMAAKAQAIYGELGRKLTFEGSGGASDASFSAGVGVPSQDGLGIVGGGFHAPEEYVEVGSIVPRLYLLTRMLMELGRGELLKTGSRVRGAF